ncbi:MAG: hypothetical protein IPK76_15845 [Lewinellaceae bacterium]|nr:hypothetical protein [Lewinellaceae bacterium]
MENIQNTRGKGYCILYIFMALFFLTALLLMLYNRSSVLDFPKIVSLCGDKKITGTIPGYRVSPCFCY